MGGAGARAHHIKWAESLLDMNPLTYARNSVFLSVFSPFNLHACVPASLTVCVWHASVSAWLPTCLRVHVGVVPCRAMLCHAVPVCFCLLISASTRSLLPGHSTSTTDYLCLGQGFHKRVPCDFLLHILHICVVAENCLLCYARSCINADLNADLS